MRAQPCRRAAILDRVIAWKQINAAVGFDAVTRRIDDGSIVPACDTAELRKRVEQGGATRCNTLYDRESVCGKHRRQAPFVMCGTCQRRQAGALIIRHDEDERAPSFLPRAGSMPKTPAEPIRLARPLRALMPLTAADRQRAQSTGKSAQRNRVLVRQLDQSGREGITTEGVPIDRGAARASGKNERGPRAFTHGSF